MLNDFGQLNEIFTQPLCCISKLLWFSFLFEFVLVYAGRLFPGDLIHNPFASDILRTALLICIGIKTLEKTANVLFNLLVSLACFIRALGLVSGTADFMTLRFGYSQKT